jgi:hypothetical protein
MRIEIHVILGQSLCITLFSPIWMVSHLTPSFSLQSQSPSIATAIMFSSKEENLYAMKYGRLHYETLLLKNLIKLKYAWSPTSQWGYVVSEAPPERSSDIQINGNYRRFK